MRTIMKLAITCWAIGMIIIFFACIFGIMGIEPVAVVFLSIGGFSSGVGVICGMYELIRFIWKQ